MTQDQILNKHLSSDGSIKNARFEPFDTAYREKVKAAMTEYASLSRQGWTRATGQSEKDGWFYDADFLRTITEKVNEQEWGETLSMEEVEAVLKAIEPCAEIPCATSSEIEKINIMKLTKDQIIDTMLEFCNEKQDFIDGKEVDSYSFSPEAFDAGATNLIAQQNETPSPTGDRDCDVKELRELRVSLVNMLTGIQHINSGVISTEDVWQVPFANAILHAKQIQKTYNL